MLREIAVDGGLKFDEGSGSYHAGYVLRVSAEKKVSTAFNHDPEVG